MKTRIKQFLLAAALGVILSVVFSSVASAEQRPEGDPSEGTPDPDVYLVSPTTVELPTVVVFASHSPELTSGCGPFYISELGCSEYLIKRTGPDGNGLYYFRFRLMMYKPGPLAVGAITWPEPPGVITKIFPFTITGSRLRYGDFGSCIRVMSTLHYTGMKALVAYYARMNTEVSFRVEEKKTVAHRDGRQRWTWVPGKSNRKLIEIGPVYQSYERHYVEFRAPTDLLPPEVARKYKGYEGRKLRGRYLVKRGKQIIKQGYVSPRFCRETPYGVEP